MTRSGSTSSDSIGALLTRRLPFMRLRVRILLRAVMLVHRPWIRVVNPGKLEDLPEPAIYAFNHNNSFESIGVPAALAFHRNGRLIHYMIDWMYLKIPVVGSIMNVVEPIPVYTKPARWRLNESYRLAHLDRSPIEACCETLRAGGSIGIFPEGTRNPDPATLLPGRPGLGRLVLATGAPVVPVGIDFPARHRLGRMPQIGRCLVRVGEPLRFEAEHRRFRSLTADLGDVGAGTSPCSPWSRPGSRTACLAVVDRVMRAISELSNKAYPYERTQAPPGPVEANGRIAEAAGGL